MTDFTSTSSKHHSDALHSLVIGDTSNGEEAIALLTDEVGKFVFDEGPLHDYKDQYPFSSSDSYFGGILRLICAFHNSYGGVIIFGVHDTSRLPGKNKVVVDSEKINRKLRETLCRPLEIRTNRVETVGGPVDLLIVPPRGTMTPPIYTTKDIGDYKKGEIYLRRGAEVLTAKGGDLSFLYGYRASAFGEQETVDLSVPSSLPPSPATIEEFVGRFAVVERIITWITTSRDPRLFLWGQGGSGKSTIAYECATLLAESGGTLKNKSGNKLDRVLYISGKATYLEPSTGKIKNTLSQDFDNAEDIYRTILALSNWTESEKLQEYTKDQLLDALEELFELEAQLIVIDDVDTLTTSKKDAGMEELFLTLTRARSGTKVLYTQRGFPSFAPNASVEVPSLTEGEFQQFLSLCCTKFKVPPPDDDEAKSIKTESEKRPLAVETMVGMRRLAGTYPDALRRWKTSSGEARQYLFSREYQQLGADDRGRHLLATLAAFNSPQSADVLRSILQFSPEQLEDAIAETRDMFLTVTSGNGLTGDLFSIGSATRLFVDENSKQLDRYSSIVARVQHFKDASKHTPASFLPIIDRAGRNMRTGNFLDAISLLSKPDLPPAFREHPEVQALLGQSYSKLAPPNVADARKCFESAFSLGYRKYEMYLAWLELEKTNRTELKSGIEVCKKVVESNGFDAKTRASFLRRLAKYQTILANESELASPQESVRLRQESVINNIKAYIVARASKDVYIDDYRSRVELSLTLTMKKSLRVGDLDGFFDLFESLLSVDKIVDEFVPVLIKQLEEILAKEVSNKRIVTARLARLNGKIGHAVGISFSKDAHRAFSDTIKSIQSKLNLAMAT